MATKTRAELIDKVIDNLGVLVAGQAPSDEEINRVDSLLNSVFASLDARDVVTIDDPGTASPPSGGTFDESFFLPLADVVANRCASAFNLAGDPKLYVLAQQGEEELRVLTRPPRTRKMLRADEQLRPYRLHGLPFNFTSGR